LGCAFRDLIPQPVFAALLGERKNGRWFDRAG